MFLSYMRVNIYFEKLLKAADQTEAKDKER